MTPSEMCRMWMMDKAEDLFAAAEKIDSAYVSPGMVEKTSRVSAAYRAAAREIVQRATAWATEDSAP